MCRTSITTLALLSIGFDILRVEGSSGPTVQQTKNYIDTIPGYAELSACAIRVLSTVVRDENSGCQDTYALTSYTCFCTESSSYFSSVILRDVETGCDALSAMPQATSALGVFDAYCALGVAAGLVTSQAFPTGAGLAPPAGSPSRHSPTWTSSPEAASAPEGTSIGIGAAVGAGIGAAVGLVGLSVAIWLLWRRRYRRAKAAQVLPSQPQQVATAGRGGKLSSSDQMARSNEMPTHEHHVCEMQSQEQSAGAQPQAGAAHVRHRPQELYGSYRHERAGE